MKSQFSPPISGEGRRIGHLHRSHTSGARRPGPAAFAAGFGIVAAVLLGVVVIAAVGSRWAAFTLALVALLFSAYLGVGLASGLHSARPPAERVDPSPLPCQCYSGSVCECPGG